MKKIVLLLCFIISISDVAAQSWELIGPDSTNWRNIIQMDVSFKEGRLPFIGTATSEGICINLNNSWRYVRPNSKRSLPQETLWYESVYFSPWNDSIAFIGANGTFNEFNEPGSIGGTVINIFSPGWWINYEIGGGYVGFSGSLSFEFSPHRENYVINWIINFYKSTDNGLLWENQHFTDRSALFISFDQAKDSVIYIGGNPEDYDTFGIYRSLDDGATWEFLNPLNNPWSFRGQRSIDLIPNGDTIILFVNHFPL